MYFNTIQYATENVTKKLKIKKTISTEIGYWRQRDSINAAMTLPSRVH